jgi:hypothetical protein
MGGAAMEVAAMRPRMQRHERCAIFMMRIVQVWKMAGAEGRCGKWRVME